MTKWEVFLGHSVDGTIGQFWKWLATIVAVSTWFIKHYVQVFNMHWLER